MGFLSNSDWTHFVDNKASDLIGSGDPDAMMKRLWENREDYFDMSVLKKIQQIAADGLRTSTPSLGTDPRDCLSMIHALCVKEVGDDRLSAPPAPAPEPPVVETAEDVSPAVESDGDI